MSGPDDVARDPDELWRGAYKIPWDDPDFSARMLAEHLSQAHDLASRRTEWIERQVAWLHETVLAGRPSRVLDLGCGPGLYAHRLAALGHRVHGIDFGPASIAYARAHDDTGRCDFSLADLRTADFGGPYEAVLFLYGQLNVFPPADALAILRRAATSLVPGGRLAAEPQTFAGVQALGEAPPVREQLESGLFSARPHEFRAENRWLADEQVAVTTFTITEGAGGPARTHRSTTRAWTDDQLRALLVEAGLSDPLRHDDWPVDNAGLTLWTAVRP